jgi:hypothetical protein
MRKMVASAVVFYGATVIAHMPFGGMTSEAVGRVLIFALVMSAAYALNIRWLDPDIPFSLSPATIRKSLPGVFVILVLVNVTPLGDFITPSGWDNVALVLACGAFFIATKIARRALFLFALGSVLARMIVDPIPAPVVAIFIAALFLHRFCLSNYELSQTFGALREKWSAVDRKTLGGWVLAFLLILLPLQFWARGEDNRVRAFVQAEAARPRKVGESKRPDPKNAVAIRLLYLVLASMIAWRWIEQSLRRKEIAEKEIRQMLSQQGFIEELPDETPVPRHFPPGARGEILEQYARLVAAAEKHLDRSLVAQTPAERGEIIREAFSCDAAAEVESWSEVTELFRRARYSHDEITDDDLDRFRRAYGVVAPTLSRRAVTKT